MGVFIIKRAFTLNYKKKLVIAGIIQNVDGKSINELNNLVVNNVNLPIQELNESLIEGKTYQAFTFDLETISEDLLKNIIEFKEGQEIKII
ncbi:hypothetical protein U9K52_21250 [Chryseobacterium sp. MHB01]|jgi:hypothetical protein|uniref:hypothetical protein n=1 Tax=Chryseobacterium TaxID=59732 RepID=UPI002AFED763|nr:MULTISPECIES: hypothetical protein [Chryseobacterium]MEA1851448.1 hypothetical protein [Chryseobacterium sp. MHB01]MEC5174252.1 hypothetical protein [Chryseobacterium nepalense]